MKALIIGGTGTISSAVVKLAVAKGWETYVLNRGNKPLPQGVTGIVADIHDEVAVAKAIDGLHFNVVAQFVAYGPDDVTRDIRLFSGHTAQYLFISTASAYQKPISSYPITESTPLKNPYWEYSRKKIEAEDILIDAYRRNGFPVTIVRPSHTYDGTKPVFALHGNKGVWQTLRRILRDKSVIIPGDGTSLWTLTHSSDFAKGFVGLMGNPHALGQSFHITSDEVMTWNQIYSVIADVCGKKLNAIHIPSEYIAIHSGIYDFRGTLLGDKANSVIFDNTKIKRVVPEFNCTVSMAEGLRAGTLHMLNHKELQIIDPDFDTWCDNICNCFPR